MSAFVSTTFDPALSEHAVDLFFRGPNDDPSMRVVQRLCHESSVAKRWWHDKHGISKLRNCAELICLMHSELSEAMEGVRKDQMDDKLPHRKMEEVELADCLVRIFDYAESKGYDLTAALLEKVQFNMTRPDHSLEARAAEGGKSF